MPKIQISHNGQIAEAVENPAYSASYEISNEGQTFTIHFDDRERDKLNFMHSGNLYFCLLLRLEAIAISSKVYNIKLYDKAFSTYLVQHDLGYQKDSDDTVIKSFIIIDSYEDFLEKNTPSIRNSIITNNFFKNSSLGYDDYIFTGCHFEADISLTGLTSVKFRLCNFLNMTLTTYVNSKMTFMHVSGNNIQINAHQPLDELIIFDSRVALIDPSNFSTKLTLTRSFVNKFKTSEFSFFESDKFTSDIESYVYISGSEIYDFYFHKNFLYQLKIQSLNSIFRYFYVKASSSQIKIEQASHMDHYIKDLILASANNINLKNIKVKNLQISDIEKNSPIQLKNIFFKQNKSSFRCIDCIFSGLSLQNTDLSKSKIDFNSTSFKDCDFTNVSWGDLKNNILQINTENLEAIRTIKNVYKLKNNLIEYLVFYKLEMNLTFQLKKKLKLSKTDQLILHFNELTGYGVSPTRSILILVLWTFFFTMTYYVYYWPVTTSSFCTFLVDFIRNFGKFISITSKHEQEKIFSLYLFLHKVILGTLYYQVILSFRKFHRKSI